LRRKLSDKAIIYGGNFMKMIKETGRKILRKIYTGLGLTAVALVFQACYGPPQVMGVDVLVRGFVKSKKTNDPIEGIQVSAKGLYQCELTDSAGEFQFYAPQEEICVIKLEDIDGAKNGSYSSREISVDLSNGKMDLGDILLDVAE
jgi:hypothetical protein